MLALAGAFLAAAAGGDAPGLPPARELLAGLAQRQRAFEQARNDYTYDVDVEVETLDGKGDVKDRRSWSYQVFFVKGRRVRRLVAQDGESLPAHRQQREDRDVQERVDDLLKDRPEDRGPKLSEILERYEFRSVARETIDDRPTIVLEFKARPGDSGLEHDDVLRRLAGRIWIDEEEKAIVRSETRNDGAIKVGRGLASVDALRVTTEFVKIDGEVWLPSRVESLVEGRVLLLKSIDQRTEAIYSGYRRFGTATEETVRP